MHVVTSFNATIAFLLLCCMSGGGVQANSPSGLGSTFIRVDRSSLSGLSYLEALKAVILTASIDPMPTVVQGSHHDDISAKNNTLKSSRDNKTAVPGFRLILRQSQAVNFKLFKHNLQPISVGRYPIPTLIASVAGERQISCSVTSWDL